MQINKPVALLSVALLVSCTASPLVPPAVDAANVQIDEANAATKRDPRANAARVTSAPIISTKVIQRGARVSLPPNIGSRRMSFNPDRPVTLFEVCDKIADFAQVDCKVTDQAPNAIPAAMGRAGQGGAPNNDQAVTQANIQSAFQSSLLGGSPQGTAGNTVSVAFSGKFAAFLDYIKSSFDTNMTYENDQIVFSTFGFTRYYVPAAPILQTITSQVSGATAGSQTGPTGSTAAQNSSTTSTLDPWSEIDATLAKLVPRPNVFALNPAVRSVNVIARPSVLANTDRYFNGLSAFLQTRIVVEATLVEIRVTDTDNFGMNLAPMLQAGQVAANFVGVAPGISGTVGSGSIAVIPASLGGSSHWASTAASIKALASEDRVARVTHANQILQNGRPAEVVLTTSQDYLKNLGLSTVAQAGLSTQQTQTDTIDYGDTFQVSASMDAGSQIQLRYSLNSTSLANLVDKQVGESSVIQLKTLPRRLFELDIPVNNGETLVIAGQEQNVARRNRTGTATANLCLIGCTHDATVERTRLVLFVTATRVADQHEAIP